MGEAGPNLGGFFLLLGTCCGGYFEKPKKVKNRWETTDTKKGRLGERVLKINSYNYYFSIIVGEHVH